MTRARDPFTSFLLLDVHQPIHLIIHRLSLPSQYSILGVYILYTLCLFAGCMIYYYYYFGSLQLPTPLFNHSILFPHSSQNQLHNLTLHLRLLRERHTHTHIFLYIIIDMVVVVAIITNDGRCNGEERKRAESQKVFSLPHTPLPNAKLFLDYSVHTHIYTHTTTYPD